MTGLYVIFSKRRQPHLSQRRCGYEEYPLDGAFGYVREEHNSRFLGRRQRDRVQISPEWIDDIRSVAADPEATFFFVENRNHENVADAIRRGVRLPIGTGATLRIDAERRLAMDLRQ
ncbi:hypothetical protein [Paenirhodobacter sp.]|uniref:hypothetical protein n=1 Tax=Paenirhodobacter sp. TaxID=1965326 RepID=UPI003B3CE33D